MARGAFLKGTEGQKIRTLIKSNTGKMARDLLRIVNKSLNRNIGLSTLQRILSQVHKYDAEHSYDERLEPWSLGSLGKYPVPPEFVPLLLKYQRECNDTIDPKIGHAEPLTIWEAMWIVRLNGLFQHSKASVLDAAIWYAFYEQVWEISLAEDNTPICDTTPLDDSDGDKIMKNINNYFPNDSKPKQSRTNAPLVQKPLKRRRR